MLGPTLVKPNRGFIIPVTIVIDEYFFAGFYEPDGSDADEPLLKIHFIFTVGLVGVIVWSRSFRSPPVITITGDISMIVSFAISSDVNTPLPISDVGAMNSDGKIMRAI